MTDPNDSLLHNRYRIQQKLGQGGMGEVYLAEDTTLPGRLVALKENRLPDTKTQEQFQREALLLARLHHPNLPQVSDYFRTDDGRQFLVMDYVRGENLQQRLRSTGRPMAEDDVLTCARQILAALHYLHTWRDPDTGEARPVVHRDIKPANIKQMPDGRYVLLDFGISKASMDEATALSARALTPGYAPLEQYDGGTDARSDIYSLGATLYALVTGKVPPSATGLAAGAPLRAVREYNRQVSRHLAGVIETAMAVLAEDRHQSAAEMYQALFNETLPDAPAPAAATPFVGGGQGSTGTRMGTSLRALRRNRRYAIPVLILTVLLFWVAVFMGWILLSDQGTSAESAETANGGPPIAEMDRSQESMPETEEKIIVVGTPIAMDGGEAETPASSVTFLPTPSPPTASVTPSATATATPDLTATADAEEARILAILATRDAKATADAPTPTLTSTFSPTPPRTSTPSPTPAPDLTATSQAQATRTAIALATGAAEATKNAPTATSTPEPLPPTATPTPLPPPTPTVLTCNMQPSGPFANLWSRRQDDLGCPLQQWPSGGFWAEQPFQNGHMFWAQDVGIYLVTVGNSQGWWRRFVDDRTIWNSSMPEYSCSVDVPGGTQQPAKGFGSVWCNNADIRQQIGFALDYERGFGDDMVLYHPFANGAIFRDSDGHTRGMAYVLFGDGTFVREGY